jgi:hypothetical protein
MASASTLTRFSFRRQLLVLAAALLGLLAFSSAAKAACSYPNTEQVFAPWGDENFYELAPDGGFESEAAGWTLLGGAKLVQGNEDQYLNNPGDDTSLALRFLGLAITPQICVNETTPSFRFMALNTGNPSSKLEVIVTYQEDRQLRIKTTDIRAGDEWEPSKPIDLRTDGDVERISRISFAPKDNKGSWQIDDLYIDPFARH